MHKKKLSAMAKNLFFVEVIWLGGVSSISGTPDGVCRKPFPTSYDIYSIAYCSRYAHIYRNSQKNRALYINRHITNMEALKRMIKKISKNER